jgi:hypothetical protein
LIEERMGSFLSAKHGSINDGCVTTQRLRAQNRLHPLAVSLAVLLGSSLPAAVRAEARAYRIAVLELGIDDVGDALARSLTEQIRLQLAKQSGCELQESRVSLEQLSLAQDCNGAQSACLDRIAHSLDVDGLVFGRLTNESGAAVAKLQLFDVATQSLKGAALATLALNEADAAAIDRKAQELVADLLQLGAARSPFSRGLAPAGEATAPASSAGAERAPAQPSSVDARKLTGYALLGGAVLSAGMSVLSFAEIDRAESDSSYDRYRRAVGQMRPAVRDVCDEAAAGQTYGLDPSSFQKVKNSCSTGRTFEVLQFIFIGSAVLTSGVSAYLLFGGERERERPPLGSVGNGRFSFHPSVQKNGGGLGLRMKF